MLCGTINACRYYTTIHVCDINDTSHLNFSPLYASAAYWMRTKFIAQCELMFQLMLEVMSLLIIMLLRLCLHNDFTSIYIYTGIYIFYYINILIIIYLYNF